MNAQEFTRGDILLLEYPVEGIDYPAGIYVLRSLLEDRAFLSLYPDVRRYDIARADLKAFTHTGKRWEDMERGPL